MPVRNEGTCGSANPALDLSELLTRKSYSYIEDHAEFFDIIKEKEYSYETLLKAVKGKACLDYHSGVMFAVMYGIEDQSKRFTPHIFQRVLLTHYLFSEYDIKICTKPKEKEELGEVVPVKDDCFLAGKHKGRETYVVVCFWSWGAVDVYGKEAVSDVVGLLEGKVYREAMRKRYKGKYINVFKTNTGLGAAFVKDRYKNVYPFLPKETVSKITTNVFGFLKGLKELKKKNVPAKRGLLFSGNPGVGKSMSAKFIIERALEKGYTVFTCSAVETNIEVLGGLYKLADILSPSIVVLEDIDFGALKREEEYTSLLYGLLEILDGLRAFNGVVTIGTTNMPETLDRAILNRPGRFDVVVNFKGISSEVDFERVLEHFFKQYNINYKLKEEDVSRIFDRVDGRSFAYLSELITRVLLYSLEKTGKAVFDMKYLEAIPDFTEMPPVKRVGGFGGEDEKAIPKSR